MKTKVAVITDSASGLTFEEARAAGVILIPLTIVVDGKEYEDLKDITTEQFLAAQKQNARTSTSLPAPGKVYELFKKTLQNFEEIVYLPMSSKLSSTYISGCTVARDFDGRVVVVDTLKVVEPLKQAALDAKKLANRQLSAKTIKDILEDRTFEDRIFVVTETLSYLARGGRISPAVASVGNLLKIKPVLEVSHGEITLFEKVRTLNKAISISLDEIEKGLAKDPDAKIMILHYHYDEVADIARKAIASRFPDREVIENALGAVILNHTGPKTLGIGYCHTLK